jgi:hypothetical protein
MGKAIILYITFRDFINSGLLSIGLSAASCAFNDSILFINNIVCNISLNSLYLRLVIWERLNFDSTLKIAIACMLIASILIHIE